MPGRIDEHAETHRSCEVYGSWRLISLLNLTGQVIGAVSVSGLPSEDDHALAFWGIQQLQQTL
ncbi:heme-binding protein [Erwinia sp. E_sp_B01_9]|uniref:heme-binding protein n=1 Tax=Erwinia sp. E_sp_B01_9 TaxID=3039403 RepID=UPI003D9BAE09